MIVFFRLYLSTLKMKFAFTILLALCLFAVTFAQSNAGIATTAPLLNVSKNLLDSRMRSNKLFHRQQCLLVQTTLFNGKF